jgi:8-oxo-dGTP pyrophosphatase MutT (NUDIX family)
MTEGVFRHVRDELVHQGAVVGFYNSYFDGPDGEFRRDVVRHPGAVSAVALDDENYIYLVKQYRAPIDKFLWELPAGKRDVAGEPVEVSVVRELEEEVGMTAASVTQIVGFYHSPGFCDEYQWIFLAQDLSPVPVRHDGVEEENMVVERFPLSKAVEMALDGTILDAKSMVGILAAARHLGILRS